MPKPRTEDERVIRDHLEAGRQAEAATRAIEAYGAELLGFLVGAMRNEADAHDVFAELSYDLWRGLPSFRGEASLRTWLYTLARNAMHRFRRDPHRKRQASLSTAGLAELEHVTREVTRTYERTDVRAEIAELRDGLDEDDRILLILRVDRALSFREIANVFAENADEAPTTETLAKREAALRKRYERIKSTLRARAEAKGLLSKRNE